MSPTQRRSQISNTFVLTWPEVMNRYVSSSLTPVLDVKPRNDQDPFLRDITFLQKAHLGAIEKSRERLSSKLSDQVSVKWL